MNFQLALDAHRRGKIEEAKKFYLLDLQSGISRYETIFNLALIEFHGNNYSDALMYFNKAIEINSNDFESTANAGICCQKIGNLIRAELLFKNAINIEKNNIQIYCHLADVLTIQGKVTEAIAWLENALILDPKSPEILANLGLALTGLGNYKEAVIYYERLINISPRNVVGISNFAICLFELGKYKESLSKSNLAISLDSKYSNGHLAKGLVLHKLQRFEEAINYYERALQLEPTSYTAQLNLSTIKISKVKKYEDIVDAIHESERSCNLLVQHNKLKSHEVQRFVPLFRLKHDVQQANFLKDNGFLTINTSKFLENMPLLLDQYKNQHGQLLVPIIENNLIIYNNYENECFKYKTPNIKNIINMQLDWRAIEEKYLKSEPEIIYIDNFLNSEALIAFQKFSLYSKVWKKDYKGCYLGAFANQGFISPLHLQLALELINVMPTLFRNQSIAQIWGFKYDTKLGSGINVHADFAKINLNFWITPSIYNLDPASGGLKIYTVPAPSTWTFSDYNRNSDQIYEYLDATQSTSITIPYKENRAVLFNSALFHETDFINFEEGYNKRRINMTYLFGNQLT